MSAPIIEGPYLRDILDQPAALRGAAAGFESSPGLESIARRLAAGAYRRVVLTGMGSSLSALYPLYLRLNHAGHCCLHVETAELVHSLAGLLAPDTLAVAVSQSGRSGEIVRLAGMLPPEVSLVAVTNDPASPLAARAGCVVPLNAGPESTVTCKTYVTTLLALEWLRRQLQGGPAPESVEAAAAVEEYLSTWRARVDEFMRLLGGVTHVFVTGRGDSLAAAETGGLILKEAACVAAEGMSCAAFRHGPLELLGPHVFVMIFQGDAADLNRRLAEDVIAAGGRARLFSEGADLPALARPLRPIAEILPVQMVSLALAALKGREAGRFERASKITAVE
jgi:glucosamine--fructose-6-phosphate aminotransferase (isomerizing)